MRYVLGDMKPELFYAITEYSGLKQNVFILELSKVISHLLLVRDYYGRKR